MNKLKSKRKKAEGVFIPQQPLQDLIDKAAQPERLVEGKSNSEAANLQQKMKVAAKILVREWLIRPTIPYEDFVYFVFCTPESIFLRLNGEWLRITRENFEEAVIESNVCTTGWLRRWTPEKITNRALYSIKRLCRELKRVSWTLPRIDRQEGGPLK
jgi:hypothetical protein